MSTFRGAFCVCASNCSAMFGSGVDYLPVIGHANTPIATTPTTIASHQSTFFADPNRQPRVLTGKQKTLRTLNSSFDNLDGVCALQPKSAVPFLPGPTLCSGPSVLELLRTRNLPWRCRRRGIRLSLSIFGVTSEFDQQFNIQCLYSECYWASMALGHSYL